MNGHAAAPVGDRSAAHSSGASEHDSAGSGVEMARMSFSGWRPNPVARASDGGSALTAVDEAGGAAPTPAARGRGGVDPSSLAFAKTAGSAHGHMNGRRGGRAGRGGGRGRGRSRRPSATGRARRGSARPSAAARPQQRRKSILPQSILKLVGAAHADPLEDETAVVDNPMHAARKARPGSRAGARAGAGAGAGSGRGLGDGVDELLDLKEEDIEEYDPRERQMVMKVLNIWRFARKTRRAELAGKIKSDNEVAAINRQMWFLSLLSIVFMVLSEELRWATGSSYPTGVMDTHVNGPVFSVFDVLIPACNAVLVWRLIALYRVLSWTKRGQWYLRSRYEAFCTSSLRVKFTAELIVLVIQPLPSYFYNHTTFPGDSWLRHLGLLMFLRVYLGARLLRDKSPMWRRRHHSSMLGLRLHVGFMSALRAELRRHPLFWMLFSILGTIFMFTYVVFVMERQARFEGSDGNIITWNDSMWFVVATLTTVGYGDVTPSNSKIYYPAMAEGFVSLVLTSVFISVVIDKLSMPSAERKLFRWVNRQTVQEKQKKKARVLLNMWLIAILKRRRMLRKCAARGRIPTSSPGSIWFGLKVFVKQARVARHEAQKVGNTDNETDPVELLLAMTRANRELQMHVRHLDRKMDLLLQFNSAGAPFVGAGAGATAGGVSRRMLSQQRNSTRSLPRSATTSPKLGRAGSASMRLRPHAHTATTRPTPRAFHVSHSGS